MAIVVDQECGMICVNSAKAAWNRNDATTTRSRSKTHQGSPIGSDAVCHAGRLSGKTRTVWCRESNLYYQHGSDATNDARSSCSSKGLNRLKRSRMATSVVHRQTALRRGNSLPVCFFRDFMVLLLTLASCVTISRANCPARCACPTTTNKVSCVNAGYSELPSPLTPMVTSLDMSNNQIATLTSTTLSPLRNVINLIFNDNQISQIHDGAFSMMTSLQELKLKSNKLSLLTEYTFSGTSDLRTLDLSNNELTGIDGAFAGMASLSRLELSDNRLTSITEFTFRDLHSLRYLILSENAISVIDRRAFRSLEQLLYLMLKGNPLGDLSRLHFRSPSLNYLDLSQCGLTRVPRGLPRPVRYLRLGQNNMTTVHHNEFEDCPYVSILILDGNMIGTIQGYPFEDMTYLQQLWLNNNRLREVPSGLPTSLQRLLMDSNQLLNITNVFPQNSQINTLSLMGNNISHLAYDALYDLRLLQTVDFSNNRIQHLYGNTFINSSQLNTLQLSKNPLQFFHSRCFHGLHSLRTLSLAYVGTEATLFPDIFQDLTELNKLDLDSSPSIILNILYKDDLIRGLESVGDMSLHSSDLTTLRSDFPRLFPHLAILHITSSRWHCDRALMWFRDWLLSSEVEFQNQEDIRCFTPRTLHDRALTSLTDDEFVSVSPSQTTRAIPVFRLTTFPPQKSTVSTTTKSTMATPQISPASDKFNPIETTSPKTDAPFDFSAGLPNPDGDLPIVFPPIETQETTTELSWEAVSKSLNNMDTTSPNPNTKYEQDPENSSVEVRTLHHDASTFKPLPQPSENEEAISRNHTTIVIVVATSLTTFVIASILLTSIIYFCRKSRRRASAPGTPSKGSNNKNSKVPPYQNGIKYHHKKDVLYFMPASGEGSESHESIKTTNSKTSKDANMSLIPGRDINHEGPLRVYKWEDF